MTQITAGLVKELRDKTGAGMMDCKKALQETEADMEAAVDWLRAKGLAAAQKKSGRVAAEGLVGVSADGARGAMVEVNSETDFVARNEKFQAFVGTMSKLVSEAGADTEALAAVEYPGAGHAVSEELTQLVATIGENMNIRRAASVEVGNGVVGSYIHGALAPGMGRIGVLVGVETDGDAAALEQLAKELAMHIAAATPESVSVESLDPESVARERSVLMEQARESGKPEEILEKMVEGRLRKFYQEAVLLEQTWVHDGESKVGEVLEAAAEAAGGAVRVTRFERFALGEGVEREVAEAAE